LRRTIGASKWLDFRDSCGIASSPDLICGGPDSGQAARRFKKFQWSTRDSWSRQRRVIANRDHNRFEP
jgi:hypothetical protein